MKRERARPAKPRRLVVTGCHIEEIGGYGGSVKIELRVWLKKRNRPDELATLVFEDLDMWQIKCLRSKLAERMGKMAEYFTAQAQQARNLQ